MPEIIGLDIGSHSIKLIGLKMTSKGPYLTCLGIKEIPPDIDKEDVNTFSEILKALVQEVGLTTKKVNLTVSGSGVQIKRISVPSLPKAELKEAVRWEMKNHLPFPVETAEIDFHVLNEYMEDNVKRLDLMVVACPKHLIDRTLSIAERAGLQPIHLDAAALAVWNTLLVWDQLRKGETVALIELGAEKTGIYLFKDGMLQFGREVTPAGADITRAIMEGMGSKGEPEATFERAEEMKQEMGISSEPSQERIGDKSASLSKISFMVRPVVERLSAEIGRSLDYYRSQFNEEPIDKLLLTGGGANLKNIASHLANELRLPVELFNPLSKILSDSRKVDAQFLDQIGSLFTIAAGMALPEAKRIELLPPKKPFLSKVQAVKLIPVAAPAIALLAFLGAALYMNGQVKTIQKEIDTKKAQMADLDVLQAKLKALKEKDVQLKEKLSQFPSSMIVPVPYRDILREVSQIVPDNITLTLLSVQSKGSPLRKGNQPPKPQEGESQKEARRELHITGVAFGSDTRCLTALAEIIERLERTPLFNHVRLVSADQDKLYTQPGAEFGIVCEINLNNPSSPTAHPPTSLSPKVGEGGISKEGSGALVKESPSPGSQKKKGINQ
jgi:type IV pilus assembly protein PilM